jgi:hypothetical protein
VRNVRNDVAMRELLLDVSRELNKIYGSKFGVVLSKRRFCSIVDSPLINVRNIEVINDFVFGSNISICMNK